MDAVLDQVLNNEAPVEELEVSSIAVSGIEIKDKLGNTFAIPDDSLNDLDDAAAGDVLAGLDLDERFHYQTIRPDQVPAYTAKGWGLCSREELGCPAAVVDTYGKPVTSQFQVGPDYVVKIPKIIHERAQRNKSLRSLRRLADLNPPNSSGPKPKELVSQDKDFPVRFDAASSILDRLEKEKI
jgi:hypothetical protein